MQIIFQRLIKMKVCLAQIAPELGNKKENIEKIKKVAEKSDAAVIFFGELFLTGYMCRDDIVKLAESLNEESVKKISKIAEENDKHIIFGMPEKDEEKRGVIYNSAVIAYPNGEVDRYRKFYLANFGPFEEKLYFAQGNDLPIFNTPIGKIGMIICFDLFFPEISKIYALRGADIIACISASPSATRIFFEKMIVARAIENTTFALYTNLVGTELNMTFWGGNAIVGPRGEVKKKGEYYKEGIVEENIDLNEIKLARKFRPTIKDTRFEVLDALKELKGIKFREV